SISQRRRTRSRPTRSVPDRRFRRSRRRRTASLPRGWIPPSTRASRRTSSRRWRPLLSAQDLRPPRRRSWQAYSRRSRVRSRSIRSPGRFSRSSIGDDGASRCRSLEPPDCHCRRNRSPMTGVQTPRKERPARRHAERDPWLDPMMVPSLCVLAIVVAYPVVFTLFLSAQDYNLVGTEPARFVGAANYRKLVGDPTFWRALANTAVYTFGSVGISL